MKLLKLIFACAATAPVGAAPAMSGGMELRRIRRDASATETTPMIETDPRFEDSISEEFENNSNLQKRFQDIFDAYRMIIVDSPIFEFVHLEIAQYLSMSFRWPQILLPAICVRFATVLS